VLRSSLPRVLLGRVWLSRFARFLLPVRSRFRCFVFCQPHAQSFAVFGPDAEIFRCRSYSCAGQFSTQAHSRQVPAPARFCCLVLHRLTFLRVLPVLRSCVLVSLNRSTAGLLSPFPLLRWTGDRLCAELVFSSAPGSPEFF
jgi:hypothetical protein